MFPLKDNLPTGRFPYVTAALIAANVLVYLLLQRGGWEIGSATAGAWSLEDFAAVPCDLAGRCETAGARADATTVLTSMFMHGSLLHLAGNVLFLWIFGNNVEDAAGRLAFLAFYLLGGAVAIGVHTLADAGSDVPTVGASGAVSAVLGAYLLLYPRARVVTVVLILFFFTLIEIPAVVFLGVWIVQQAVLAGLDQAGNVAVFAHIGGFLFGLAVIRLLVRQPRPAVPAPYRV